MSVRRYSADTPNNPRRKDNMNIERLAKRLKEFTLDDIELIAECDCKTKLEQLLNSNKIVFETGFINTMKKRKLVKIMKYSAR